MNSLCSFGDRRRRTAAVSDLSLPHSRTTGESHGTRYEKRYAVMALGSMKTVNVRKKMMKTGTRKPNRQRCFPGVVPRDSCRDCRCAPATVLISITGARRAGLSETIMRCVAYRLIGAPAQRRAASNYAVGTWRTKAMRSASVIGLRRYHYFGILVSPCQARIEVRKCG
jgi:hypothetical protein